MNSFSISIVSPKNLRKPNGLNQNLLFKVKFAIELAIFAARLLAGRQAS